MPLRELAALHDWNGQDDSGKPAELTGIETLMGKRTFRVTFETKPAPKPEPPPIERCENCGQPLP